MQVSDYTLILTSIFLGACALFVPYLSEVFKRKAFAPDPRIEFKLEPPYCHKTFFRSKPNVQPQVEEPVFYFRFIMENRGKSRANRCEVVLENLWIYDASQTPIPYPNFSPVNMVWVGVGATGPFVDINPRRRIFCDIGHISSKRYQQQYEKEKLIDVLGYTGDDLRFLLDLGQYFYSQPSCFGPGRYILQVAFYSENAGSQRFFFDISWSGRWRDSESEMFREAVVKITNRPDG
jgi:hypothetical protein